MMASYHWPAPYVTTFIPPAPPKPDGTKFSALTDDDALNGPASTRLSSVAPGSTWPIWLTFQRARNSTLPGPKATPPSLYSPIVELGPPKSDTAPKPLMWLVALRVIGTL